MEHVHDRKGVIDAWNSPKKKKIAEIAKKNNGSNDFEVVYLANVRTDPRFCCAIIVLFSLKRE